MIVKPVGAVIRLPGKIVGSVVCGVTHVFSHKTPQTTTTTAAHNEETDVINPVHTEPKSSSKIDLLIFKRLNPFGKKES